MNWILLHGDFGLELFTLPLESLASSVLLNHPNACKYNATGSQVVGNDISFYSFCYFCRVIAFLVLNIILSAFTLCLIVPDSISISHPWLSISRFPFNCDYSVGPFDRPCTRDSSGFLAPYVLMLILAVVQAVTAIVASGISCAAVCQTCIVTITKLQLLVTSYSYQ